MQRPSGHGPEILAQRLSRLAGPARFFSGQVASRDLRLAELEA